MSPVLIMMSIFIPMLFGTMGLAIKWGGKPEYCGAAIMIFGWLFTLLAAALAPRGFQTIEIGIFAVDLVILALFLWMALTSKRYWPLWVTGFHLCAIITHVAAGLMPKSLPLAYYHLQGKFYYLMCFSILAGAYGQRALKRSKAPAQPN